MVVTVTIPESLFHGACTARGSSADMCSTRLTTAMTQAAAAAPELWFAMPHGPDSFTCKLAGHHRSSSAKAQPNPALTSIALHHTVCPCPQHHNFTKPSPLPRLGLLGYCATTSSFRTPGPRQPPHTGTSLALHERPSYAPWTLAPDPFSLFHFSFPFGISKDAEWALTLAQLEASWRLSPHLPQGLPCPSPSEAAPR